MTVETVTGKLNTFLVEEFVPHKQADEVYLCIQSDREGEEILFHHEGGVDVGDVDAKARRLHVPIGADVDAATLADGLLVDLKDPVRKQATADFTAALFQLYRSLHFVYLEINPIVLLVEGEGDKQTCRAVPLDMAAKIDEAAEFVCGDKWAEELAAPAGAAAGAASGAGADAAGVAGAGLRVKHISFPQAFGKPPLPEEQYIKDLDAKTGSSLKLTVLNPKGRVWTMVAGGGASVAYADTISDLGFGGELANYGEYSGAPSEALTFEYAKTVLSLMTRAGTERLEDGGMAGKVLIIGGGIANFTDVAKTFRGIMRALRGFAAQLRAHRVSIWVRRGGPNYVEGLRLMRELGRTLGVPVNVRGPETHITAIVPKALEELLNGTAADFNKACESTAPAAGGVPRVGSALSLGSAERQASSGAGAGGDDAPVGASSGPGSEGEDALGDERSAEELEKRTASGPWDLFHRKTRAFVYGMQLRAVQGMLDFDFLCRRSTPSVAAILYPFGGQHMQQFYWGQEQVMIPVYRDIGDACAKHPDVDVLVNFASLRSSHKVSMDALRYPQLRTLAVIAEGVPEHYTRELIRAADDKGVSVIGPATVGGIKPGCFKIGNTGGMIDNIVASKLYRPGSVCYVSKSGGMSNELNNIMAKHADGVCEGVAIGGDRYPGSRFIDHLMRYERNPNCKMMVLLGEVGGTDEYAVAQAIEEGRITKPVIAWCIGTCAKIFPFEVQFGHAGALAGSAAQTADAKNAALKKAGAIVPENFNDFAVKIGETFLSLVGDGTIVQGPEITPPQLPMDYQWAKQLGLIRKPAAFVSTISDERGDELKYAGMKISDVFKEDLGVGGVLSLLWFKRRLPAYATKFIEMVLMVTADHGPAVAGAHNTIVAARAGKDLISSLASGLLTIGPRFGGALDGAAKQFSQAYDRGLTAGGFVSEMRKQHQLIMGIGHKVKSIHNPDKRVEIVKEYAMEHFPECPVLRFALQVEEKTTKKKPNLILNVDGCIAVCFVDLMRSCGAFSKEEADEVIANGCLNGLFVLGRSIGLMGHFLDQKRLKQGLYRHPTEDIAYVSEMLADDGDGV